MTESRVAVFRIGVHSSLGDGWQHHPGVEVESVNDSEELFRRAERTGGHCLLDLTCGMMERVDSSVTRRFLDGYGAVLADPWIDVAADDLFTFERISSGRTIVYAPSVYHPVLLELRRIVGEKVLGDVAGIEISASSGYETKHLMYTICHLFGLPSGQRAGPVDFLWFGRCGCSVARCCHQRTDFLSLALACKKGLLKAEVSDTPYVKVLPAGKRPYRLPLPEGDGVYYNRKDAIDSVLAQASTQAFPPSVMVSSYRWVQENVHEGT